MNRYCWFFGENCIRPNIEFCFKCPFPQDRYKVDRTTNMFKENMHEYIRIVLRTKSSYRIMAELIDTIDDMEQKKTMRSQLYECTKDCDTLISELKRHGHL